MYWYARSNPKRSERCEPKPTVNSVRAASGRLGVTVWSGAAALCAMMPRRTVALRLAAYSAPKRQEVVFL